MKFDHRNINVNNICQIIDIQLKNTMFLLMNLCGTIIEFDQFLPVQTVRRWCSNSLCCDYV